MSYEGQQDAAEFANLEAEIDRLRAALEAIKERAKKDIHEQAEDLPFAVYGMAFSALQGTE